MEKSEWIVDVAASVNALPRYLPRGWMEVRGGAAGVYGRAADGFRVLMTVMRHPEHGVWLHASCSYEKKLPDYWDMKTMRRLFMRSDLPAVELHVCPDEHVNKHEFVRHLWQRLDARATPDFREMV